MLKALTFATLAALLAGCATPVTQGANELGGVIRYGNRYSGDEAFAQAEAQCAQHNRIARVTSQAEGFVFTLVYECVERPS